MKARWKALTRSSGHGHAPEFSCADCTPKTAGAVETFFEEHGGEVVTVVLRTVARYETQPLETDDAWGNLPPVAGGCRPHAYRAG